MSDQNDSTDYSVSEIRFTWRVFANSKDEASAFLQERIDEDADFDGAIVDNMTGYVKRAYCYCTWLVPEDELTALRRDLETANARALQAERERDALMAQLDRMGLSNLVKDEQLQRSKRVFVYGAAFHLDGVSGQYGWITREDQSKPNPYHIITDGSIAGLWYKPGDFKRVVDAAQPAD